MKRFTKIIIFFPLLIYGIDIMKKLMLRI